jgi:general secretion pathway protein C
MSIDEVFANPRVRQWLPGVLNAAMLLLLTASMAHWTWLLAKPPLHPLGVTSTTLSASPGDFSVQPLLSAHLFGQASQALMERRLDNLPISSLNLILTGVIASPGGGYALISANGQAQESYTVGDMITAGAVLQAVFPDRVVIRRNGILESLMLQGFDKTNADQRASVPAASRAATNFSAIVKETSANHFSVERENLAAQMRTPEFLRQATVVPASDGGFLVRHIQPGSLYEKLGLQIGDVIKTINGQPVNTIEDAIRQYQQLDTVTAVEMQINRGGKIEQLHYQFAQN